MNTPKLHAMKTLSALTLSAAILTLGATVSAQEVTYWDGTTDEPVSCKPDVRKEIKTKTTSTPEQLKIGQAKYNAICSACHGEKGLGNGAAAAALNPKPRNLVKEPYKKGTSILALYDIVTNGLEGTQMAGFEAALSEPERWAVAHYVQNEFLPKERVETMTDKQLEDVCMGLSKPPKPPALPVEFAMQLLVEESNSRRNTRMTSYGAVKLNDDGDKNHGAMVWKSACSSCHGPSGQGNADLGHYGRFPYVALSARTLQNEAAGGTWDTFVARVDGAHATIPSMTPTAWLDDRDWKSLQAYMSGMKGSAQVTTDRPPPKPPALLSVEPTYELFMRDDKVFKLANPEEEGQSATVTEITDYATFREAYKPILVAEGETMEPLPEAQPADGVKVRVAVEMACVGTTNGCGADALKAEEGKTIATGERTIMFK